MKKRPRTTGYVLLVTLMVIALAGAAMVGVSRKSLRRAVDASEAEQDLQRRWGVLSAQETLLPRAPLAIQAAEREAKTSLSSVTVPLRLGTQSFTVRFEDEQAKVNVNTLHRRNAPETERMLRQLLPADFPADRVQLAPFPQRQDPRSLRREAAFQSFGQLFAVTPPESLAGSTEHKGIAQRITCWGNGVLHFRRASGEAIQVLLTPALNGSQVQQLLSARSEPNASLSKILPALGLTRARRAQVEGALTENSECHSLWVIVHTRHRKWYHLAVSNPEGDGMPLRFEW